VRLKETLVSLAIIAKLGAISHPNSTSHCVEGIILTGTQPSFPFSGDRWACLRKKFKIVYKTEDKKEMKGKEKKGKKFSFIYLSETLA
jgi:hypothetical protein